MRNVRRLQFEAIEPRHMMSGITAVLHPNGVLSIIATDHRDTVSVQNTGTKLKIRETGQAFALDQVKSIIADLGDGDDVFKYVETLGAMPSRKISIRLESAGGADKFRGPSRQDVYFGGPDRTLTVDRFGTVRIDGHRPDWFDYNVPFTEVGILARQLAVDQVLNFNDMVDLFDLAAERRHVGERNFKGLRAIVKHDAFFPNNLEYVQSLSTYVMFPCAANAYFQKEHLGNLSAASKGEQLETLVNKWFLGLDHPVMYVNRETNPHPGPLEYLPAEGALFGGEPNMGQIHQGASADCYFMSSLEAIAIHNPKVIEEMFSVNTVHGQEVYTIRFFDPKDKFKAFYVTVDKMLPVKIDDSDFLYDDNELKYYDSENVLWSALAEKAYAQLSEFGWSQSGRTANSYKSIYKGEPSRALAQITGQLAERHELTHASLIYHAFLNEDRPVVLGSKTPSGNPLIPQNHDLALVDVSISGNQVKFKLFDPWGLTDSSKPGLIWLTWEQLTKSFDEWSVGSTL